MFWENKPGKPSDSRIILGMILLSNDEKLDLARFSEDFNSHYQHTISETAVDEMALAFSIGGESVILGMMSFPVPWQEISDTSIFYGLQLQHH